MMILKKREKKLSKKNLDKIDKHIEYCLNTIDDCYGEPADVEEQLTNIDNLVDLKERLQKLYKSEKFGYIDIDSLIYGGLGLAGVLLIIGYEKENIMSSNAFSIVGKFFRR